MVFSADWFLLGGLTIKLTIMSIRPEIKVKLEQAGFTSDDIKRIPDRAIELMEENYICGKEILDGDVKLSNFGLMDVKNIPDMFSQSLIP